MNERHAQHKNPNVRVNNRPQVCLKSYSANPNVVKNLQVQIPKYKSLNGNSRQSGNGSPIRAPPDHFGEIRGLLCAGQHHPRHAVEGSSLSRVPDEEGTGLSLELEIDESIKNLLRQGSFDKLGKNYNNVDVTFIQQEATSPAPLQATVSLGMDEVSQLIDMVHAKGNKLSTKNDKLGNTTVDHELLDYFTTDYATDGSDDLYARGISPPKSQQIYTTPQQTFNQIRSKLPCLTQSHTGEEDFDKPGTPCLCQHCGMVGVLVESQKRPAIPHSPNPKFTGSTRNASQRQNTARIQKKIIDLRTKSKSETNLILLKELTSKIASLEDRLSEHEERTVKKDYFKFVIHKLLTQYSNKINELRTATYYPNKQNVNIATQYSKKLVPQKSGYEKHDRTERSERSEKPEKDPSRYYPVKVSNNQNRLNPKSSTEDLSSERHYKKAHRTKTGKRTANTSVTKNEMTHVSTNVKTMFMAHDDSLRPFVAPQSHQGNSQDNLSAHAIKNLCDIVYHKYCDSNKQKEQPNQPRDREKVVPEKLLNVSQMTKGTRMSLGDGVQPNTTAAGLAGSARNRKEALCANRMDVAYVSPALETWQDESDQEFVAAKNNREHEQKREQQQHSQYQRNNSGRGSNANDAKNKTKHSVEDKIKYLKYLAKRKNVDESELWTNILNQAKKHIRSNEDTVSIQLPSLLHGPEMSELELTLFKLKDIAKKARVSHKKSSTDLNYCSSSERLNPFLAPSERKRTTSPPTSNFQEDDPRRHFIAR